MRETVALHGWPGDANAGLDSASRISASICTDSTLLTHTRLHREAEANILLRGLLRNRSRQQEALERKRETLTHDYNVVSFS